MAAAVMSTCIGVSSGGASADAGDVGLGACSGVDDVAVLWSILLVLNCVVVVASAAN